MIYKRPRSYKKCCANIVTSLRDQLRKEKQLNKHLFGITRVSDRLKSYTQLGTATLSKLIRNDVPDCNFIEKRDRISWMSRDDELKIRPAILNLVKNKSRVNVSQLNIKLGAENPDWIWIRK